MYFTFYFSWFSGRDETMQPAKPSFLEYFEQKEKENQINSFGKSAPGPLKNSSDWKVPQDGDYEFVSSAGSTRLCPLRKAWETSHLRFCRLRRKCLGVSRYGSHLLQPRLEAAPGRRASWVWHGILTDTWAVLVLPVNGVFFTLKILYSLAIFLVLSLTWLMEKEIFGPHLKTRCL